MSPGRPIRRAVVVGTTAWGTTLAVLLARNGLEVALWARNEEEATRLRADGENRRRRPGLRFPPSLSVASDPALFLGAQMVVVAVASHTVRQNLSRVGPFISPDAVVVSAIKGLEVETGLRMSEVIADAVPALANRISVLSGPNLSAEVAAGLPAAAVVASADLSLAARVQRAFMSAAFRVYTSTDVVGVELAGALKNIFAIGAGLADGLGFGDNAKAALLTRGLAEMTRLGLALGAQPLTFAGLAGMGDLIATCYSDLSRNHRLGRELAAGRSLEEVLRGMDEVAEGVNATQAACALARRLGVEMPIAETARRVLFEGLDPRRAVAELMLREPKHELTGIHRPAQTS